MRGLDKARLQSRASQLGLNNLPPRVEHTPALSIFNVLLIYKASITVEMLGTAERLAAAR
jgi:hypothetical protein